MHGDVIPFFSSLSPTPWFLYTTWYQEGSTYVVSSQKATLPWSRESPCRHLFSSPLFSFHLQTPENNDFKHKNRPTYVSRNSSCRCYIYIYIPRQTSRHIRSSGHPFETSKPGLWMGYCIASHPLPKEKKKEKKIDKPMER